MSCASVWGPVRAVEYLLLCPVDEVAVGATRATTCSRRAISKMPQLTRAEASAPDRGERVCPRATPTLGIGRDTAYRRDPVDCPHPTESPQIAADKTASQMDPRARYQLCVHFQSARAVQSCRRGVSAKMTVARRSGDERADRCPASAVVPSGEQVLAASAREAAHRSPEEGAQSLIAAACAVVSSGECSSSSPRRCLAPPRRVQLQI
jgi:hypothetical protein